MRPSRCSSRPARRRSVTTTTGGPPAAARSSTGRQSRSPHVRASPARSARIHIVPPHTSPVFQARSSVSSYARREWPPRSRISRETRIASASTQPPPSVPAARPRSSPGVTTILAPTTWGVEPCVRTTVATANGRPASASSDITRKIVGTSRSYRVRSPGTSTSRRMPGSATDSSRRGPCQARIRSARLASGGALATRSQSSRGSTSG